MKRQDGDACGQLLKGQQGIDKEPLINSVLRGCTAPIRY
jgi:hypothetical protein